MNRMKKALLLVFGLVALSQVQAQLLNPVSWSFTAVKTGDKTYEIHMKATIQEKWHLYSQVQPENRIAEPTTFTIQANPLFKLEGKIKELGRMEVMNDKDLGISANQYSQSVDFVQKIKLKANAKTNFSGTVAYQTCDDKKCLPLKTVRFNVALN